MKKVNIATKEVAEAILSKMIIGLGCSKDLIEIEVVGDKKLLFKLNELDQSGFPTIFLKDCSDERKVNAF